MQANRKLSAFWIALATYIAAGGILDLWFKHKPITGLYSTSLGAFVNRILKGVSASELSSYLTKGDDSFFKMWLALLLLMVIVFVILRPGFFASLPFFQRQCRRHSEEVEAIPEPMVNLAITLAACLSLFAELMIVRLHSSYFQLFSYFKNASLLSCFLGLGIGYATKSQKEIRTPLFLPMLAVQTVFLYLFRLTPMGSFLQNPVSEQFSMGSGLAKGIAHIAIVDSFLLLIFAFNAICFIPLGHLVARLMMRRKNLHAYSLNLVGSLLGIGLLSLISFLWTPPWFWILLAAVMVMAFLTRDGPSLATAVTATLLIAAFLCIPFNPEESDVYSPYQTLTLKLSQFEPPYISASNTYYQRILDLRADRIRPGSDEARWEQYYGLPYHFTSNPEDVLIVGAGTGNDVASALRNGARKVDAVEIDPAILEFGRRLHPEAPYQNAGVRVLVNDARAHFRTSKQKYDLIVFGLLDSHTLLSGLSGGIRLDSYVYTVDAFREAKRLLKPDGTICLTFYLMNPQLGRKLFLMLQEAFDGRAPEVYQVGYDGGYAFLIGGDGKKGSADLPSFLVNVTRTFADTQMRADKSTDDWPFFYMPLRKYPITYVVIIVALLAVSLLYIRHFIPWSESGFSVPCCFLGAGFMLVETKGITELALVFGSTWIVTAIVIGSILMMAFLANLLVIKMGMPVPGKIYPLLLLSLLAGLGWTFLDTSSMSIWLIRILASLILTLPLFFSGMAFSSEVGKSDTVASALSSNLLGAMIGGFLEYNSMYFGFRSLYIFAIVMYAIAFGAALRSRPKLCHRSSLRPQTI